MKGIPLAKPLFGAEEEEAVIAVLRSGQIGPGPRVREFEERFAQLHHAAHGIACANGTVAIERALAAAGVGPGDEVIVPAFTFIATANAVLAVGARPVFADIDPQTYCLDAADAARKRTGRTAAIIAVHLYGYPADLTGLRTALPDVPIIEDCAQAHMAEHRGRRVGALGRAGTFSFYPTKNMTTAEGGIVLTNDAAIADGVRSAMNHGRQPDAKLGTYDHVRWGTNVRMSDLHAAVGLAQLKRVQAWTEQRRENASRLNKELAGIVTTPVEHAGDRHVYHQYTIRTARRDAIIAALRARSIGFGIYYPRVLYAYPHLASFATPCPSAELAVREVLSLPVHPSLTASDIEEIGKTVREAL